MLTDLESCGCSGGLGDATATTPAPEPPVTGTPVAVIALGAGAVALGLWALLSHAAPRARRRRSRYTGRVAEVYEGKETMRLPFETMRDVVFERRR